jgi:D-2-hydroxyglutarate dehydrogenase
MIQGYLDCYYGHVGDGNMHYNIMFDSYEELKREQAIIEPKIFNLVKHYKGSISAEHGIGQNKPMYLPFQKGIESVSMMRNLKTLFDPNNILNPGKVLPPDN